MCPYECEAILITFCFKAETWVPDGLVGFHFPAPNLVPFCLPFIRLFNCLIREHFLSQS